MKMLRKYKQFMIGFLVGALLFSLSPVFAEGELNIINNPFPILINGQVAEVEGYNINGYTFLKLADFGKTGLVVKFNETEKRIEIESVGKNSSERGDDKVSDGIATEATTSDGLTICTIDGVRYIAMADVCDKYDKYAIGVSEKNSQNLALKLRQGGFEVIDSLDFKIINYMTYVTVDYYTSTVQPIVAEGF